MQIDPCTLDFRQASWCWLITSDLSDRRVILTVVFMSIGSDVMRVKSGNNFVLFSFSFFCAFI